MCYYDVVCGIYESEKCNSRIDSHLICGGFKTEDEAQEYVDTHDCRKEYKRCYSKGYPRVEIEVHNSSGNLIGIIEPII